MKARDVVPGWPRGRSTIAAYCSESWKQMGPVWLAWPSQRGIDAARRLCDERRLLEDRQQERDYHEGQQLMLNNFRHRHPAPIRGFVIVNGEVVGTLHKLKFDMDLMAKLLKEGTNADGTLHSSGHAIQAS